MGHDHVGKRAWHCLTGETSRKAFSIFFAVAMTMNLTPQGAFAAPSTSQADTPALEAASSGDDAASATPDSVAAQGSSSSDSSAAAVDEAATSDATDVTNQQPAGSSAATAAAESEGSGSSFLANPAGGRSQHVRHYGG